MEGGLELIILPLPCECWDYRLCHHTLYGAGNQNQSFVTLKQVFYLLSYTPSFQSDYFPITESVYRTWVAISWA